MSVCLFSAGAGVRLFASQNRFVCVPISCHCVCVRLSLLTVRNLGRALRTTQRGSTPPPSLPFPLLPPTLPNPKRGLHTHTLHSHAFFPPALIGVSPSVFPLPPFSPLYVREKKIKVEGIFLLIDILYE